MNNQYYNEHQLNVNNNLNFNQGSNSATKFDKKDQDNEEDGPFEIYGPGNVKYAELHSSANKPLRQLNPINSTVQVCPCCNSYLATKGILEPYSMCDKPDDFSNCGQGVVLYYAFLKYIIMVSVIISIGTSAFNAYLSNSYYNELTEVCNNVYRTQIKGTTGNENIYPACNLYYTEADKDFIYYSIVDTFLFRFSSVIAKDYRNLTYALNIHKTDTYEETVVNMSRINFSSLMFLFIFNLVFIFFLYNKSNAADFLVLTVSDYAVFMYNLYDVHGKFLNIKKEIEEKRAECTRTGKKYVPELVEQKKIGFFIDQIPSEIDQFKEFIKCKICKGNYNENFKINRIDFSYKIGELKKLQDKLENKKMKISKVENFPEFQKKNEGLNGDDRKYHKSFLEFCDSDDEKPLSKIKERRDEIQENIENIIEESKKNTMNYFGGAAIVTFDTIKEQELYMKNIPNNAVDYAIKFLKDLAYVFCSCCINKSSENIYYLKRNIKFEDAPEPEDIIYENLEVSYGNRILRTIGIYIISILICGVSFIIVVELNELQITLNEKDKSGHITFLYVLSLVLSVITSAIDVILEIVFETFTKWEKHTTMTHFYLSYSVKLTIFSFLNSGLLPLISELVFNESEGHEILISNMLMKFLVNAFVSPIMWTLSVGYYLKQAQIFLYKRKILIGTKTQKDLNTLFELPPMNVSAKYSYIFKTLLMSFLYIPIFPLGVAISFIGFAIAYWLEKINFAYYYKKPEMLNRYLCEFYTSYFVVVLFAYGVGDYIFMHDAYDTKTWSLLNIVVFGVLIIIPYNKLLSQDYIKFSDSQLYSNTYDQSYPNFNMDYERANPMTKQEGVMRYETARKERGLITNEEYQQNIKVVQNRDIMAGYFNRPRNYGRGFMGPQQINNNMFQPPYNNGNQVNIYNNNTREPNFPGYVPVNNPTNNINNQNIYGSQEIQPQMENQKLKANKSKVTGYSKNAGFASGNTGNVPIQASNPFQNNGFYPGGPGNLGFSGVQGYAPPPPNFQNAGYSSHN